MKWKPSPDYTGGRNRSQAEAPAKSRPCSALRGGEGKLSSPVTSAVLFCVLVVVVAVMALSIARSRGRTASSAPAVSEPPAATATASAVLPVPPAPAVKQRAAPAAPFRPGEKLEYRIGWMNLAAAATAQSRVLPRQGFDADASWHFQAIAHTENALRYLMVLDDQFDSYARAGTFATLQYELYLNEQGKRATRKLRFNGRAPGAETVVAPVGTRDPLAALYDLRSVNWRRVPEVHSPIFDGNHFYQMRARVAAMHDGVTVPAGNFDATRIAVDVTSSDSGVAPLHFTLWLANDSSRAPVELDAEVAVGAVKCLLVKAQTAR